MKSILPISPNQQRQLLYELAEYSSDLVIIADRSRIILYANRSACEKTGYTSHELIGSKVPTLYPKPRRASYTAKVSQGLQSTGHWKGEVEVLRKDGTTFWTDAVILHIHDKLGRPAGTVGIGRDLTDRRLLGQREWESPDQLQTVLESMDDGVCVSDLDGKILMCNDAHCRMLGYRKEEIIGVHPPYPWVDPVDLPKLRYGLKLLLKHGPLKNYTITWRRRDESAVTVSLALSLLRSRKKHPAGVVMTMRDVTDVQYVEDLRRTNERLLRLTNDVQRKAERIQTLEDINWLVLNNADMDRIFKAITASVIRLVPHDLAGIYVCDAEKEVLSPHTLSKQTPFSRRLAKFPLTLGEGIVGAAAVSGNMVWVNNAQNDPRSRYPEGMRPETEHFIAVPLKGRGWIFGVLVVARHRSPMFIEEEASIVKSFANAVTVALENARMYEELTRSQHDLHPSMNKGMYSGKIPRIARNGLFPDARKGKSRGR